MRYFFFYNNNFSGSTEISKYLKLIILINVHEKMSILSAINKLYLKFNKEIPSKEVISKVLSIYFGYQASKLNGLVYAEELGLTFTLNNQEAFSEYFLSLVRSLPQKNSDIILVLLLLSDIPFLLKKSTSKYNSIGQLTNVLCQNSCLSSIGLRTLPSYFQSKPFAQIHKPQYIVQCVKSPKEIKTFEEFYSFRFNDVLQGDIILIPNHIISSFIQSILCGRKSKFITIDNDHIQINSRVRFQDHSLLSTQSLLSKFISIGNLRLKIINSLKNDALSFEIRRHLTKFDAYTSTLSNCSPGTFLSKIRPFQQVFQWFNTLLQQSTFTEIHAELTLAAQIKFKSEFALQLWSSAFEEQVRPLYTYAFTIDFLEPSIMHLFKPVELEILWSGRLLRILHETAPEHPIFSLGKDFSNAFLNLENRLDEYRSSCELAIELIRREWRIFYKKAEEKQMKIFEDEKARIKDLLRINDLRIQAELEEKETEKRKEFQRLEREARELEQLRREHTQKEREEEKVLLERNMSRKAANPLMRPLTDEEVHLVELEKVDLFLEFSEKMKELGASEEQIMKFFPELNLPEDEIDALLGRNQKNEIQKDSILMVIQYEVDKNELTQ